MSLRNLLKENQEGKSVYDIKCNTITIDDEFVSSNETDFKDVILTVLSDVIQPLVEIRGKFAVINGVCVLYLYSTMFSLDEQQRGNSDDIELQVLSDSPNDLPEPLYSNVKYIVSAKNGDNVWSYGEIILSEDSLGTFLTLNYKGENFTSKPDGTFGESELGIRNTYISYLVK